MKTTSLLFPLFLGLATLASGQGGSLTPPAGPPGPVMKTLDQIEARTPLVAGAPGVTITGDGTIIISERGSYYLTNNLTISVAGANGIVVNVNNVTLDLNGFSLVCNTVNGGSAIRLGTASNGVVRNGSIVGNTTVAGAVFTKSGWEHGVNSTSTSSANVRVSHLLVQGVREKGINCPFAGSFVEHCSVNICGNQGISASNVVSSSVRNAGATAINCPSGDDGGSVSNCFAQCVAATGQGIYAPDGAVENSKGIAVGAEGVRAKQATNCHGSSVSEPGLWADVADNCTGVSDSGPGLFAANASNCSGTSNSGFGLLAASANHCYGSSASVMGLSVTGTASFCRASRANGGVALSSTIAIGCTTNGGSISAGQKFLGTP
jgi:hypothetical protein